jgi:hypothetical protein
MTYGELKTLIAGYIKRDDLSAEIAGFIDRARVRIGNDLRARDNRAEATISVTSGAGILPTNFAEVIAVRDSDNRPLRAAGPDDFWQYKQASGSQGLVYLVDQSLQIAPTVTGDYTLTYFREFDVFTADSNIVPVEDCFIAAASVDAFLYAHNADMARLHEERYREAFTRRNNEYSKEQPIVRRIAQYGTYQGAL